MSQSTASVRILVTGGLGFVGRHLIAALKASGCNCEIIAGSHGANAAGQDGNVRSVPLDVTNADQVYAVISREQPTHLFHLAAIAAVPAAQRDIRKTWELNFGGTLNIALAASEAAPCCRVLYCSSAEVYGHSFRVGVPLDEGAVLDPVNPYGASKAAADLMVGQMAKQGLRAIRLRPFNHTGRGQDDSFVVPAFAAQIARIERGEQEPVIRVGNLESRRDLLDVNDVIDAYCRAIERFDKLPNGCVINIASGRAIRIADILETLLSLSSAKIEVVQDAARMRNVDTPVVVGNAGRAHELLDWVPRVDISVTLASVLDDYRGRRDRR